MTQLLIHDVDSELLAPTEPTTHIDNEYSRAGIQDPKLVVTTSRDPSSKLLQFSKVRLLCYQVHVRIDIRNHGKDCISDQPT